MTLFLVSAYLGESNPSIPKSFTVPLTLCSSLSSFPFVLSSLNLRSLILNSQKTQRIDGERQNEQKRETTTTKKKDFQLSVQYGGPSDGAEVNNK